MSEESDLRDRASVASAYWLDCSPHERSEEDGLVLAKYFGVALKRIIDLEARAKKRARFPMLKYAWLAVKHKWFVFLAGLRIGCPLWRLITHDLSKFRPSELPYYGRQFLGKADDPKGFINCWLRHQNRNDHHWEYWIPRTGQNRCDPPFKDDEPLPMPEGAVLEMVADWMGAGRAYEGKWPSADWPWLFKNYPGKIKPRLHFATRIILRNVIKKHVCFQGIDLVYDDDEMGE